MERTVEAVLKGELARGDLALRGVAPVLTHMLGASGSTMVTEAIVARLRGMLHDLGKQLADAVHAQSGGETSDDGALATVLAEHLYSESSVLSHCYALAVEAQITENLERRLSLDPVLSPLMQELIASDQQATSEMAMTTLAAQSRFVQCQRRMDLPIGELPAELFHSLVTRLESFPGIRVRSDAANAASALKQAYDEGASRLGLLARVISSIGNGSRAALDLEHAGIGLFASALAARSVQRRELAVLSCHENQIARFALGLRAADLDASEAEKQLRLLHADQRLPNDFDTILPKEAQSILRNSDPRSER